MHEVEYLGYLLSREGIKPLPEKVTAIIAIKPPTNVQTLWGFLGLVQYYRDMWKRRSYILSPLTDLVGKGKKKFTWTSDHQKAFDDMKAVIAKETILNYPKFDQCFDIHTDANNRQLGAVIS